MSRPGNFCHLSSCAHLIYSLYYNQISFDIHAVNIDLVHLIA